MSALPLPIRTVLFGLAVAAGLAAASCGDDASEATSSATSSSTSTGVGGAGGAGGGGAMTTPAENYCTCMLFSCHDWYHMAFGPETDEPAALATCLAEAEKLPLAGMDVAEGNFIECRIHYCVEGQDDESVCPNTIGLQVCVD